MKKQRGFVLMMAMILLFGLALLGATLSKSGVLGLSLSHRTQESVDNFQDTNGRLAVRLGSTWSQANRTALLALALGERFTEDSGHSVTLVNKVLTCASSAELRAMGSDTTTVLRRVVDIEVNGGDGDGQAPYTLHQGMVVSTPGAGSRQSLDMRTLNTQENTQCGS
ncbi:hypothetical protein [Larsenimonas salina]|uniref:hypothetical protein n=1 Tax=Larsenimonas salina TaxID=1295565 RepID=UPI0020732C17|nr:hypothetical protein [Larsenimonas salina]MCM5705527.1 hypothetical protein [Larsenimonas salina]